MASLQLKNESYYCQFRYLGKRHTVTIGKVSADEAEAFAGSVDLLLMRIRQKLLRVPPGIGIDTFILRGGKIEEDDVPGPAEITFAEFCKRYIGTHSNGAMEQGSLATVAMHLRHFERTLGNGFTIQGINAADLQKHIDHRAKKKYRGKPLSPVTLRKEMATLRAAWNWAAHMGIVIGPFPSKGLVYPKLDEKPPFMTWAEISRKTTPTMKDVQKEELWNCLYLTRPELDELLEFVRENAGHPWVYPMFCFAAFTGARRSELLRVLIEDVDFDGGTVLLREKKRSRKSRTTRRVPLTPVLTTVVREWLKEHPGSPFLFAQPVVVVRSRKKRAEPTPITRDEAHDHFKRTLAGSKWEVIRGWHIFRHTFVSLAASAGVDQRHIDEWVGHQTDEQRKRYRHLLPSAQQEAIRLVFGGQ